MAADYRHRPAAQDHTRAGSDALADGVAESEHSHVLGAVLPDGRYAGEEGRAGVSGRLQGEYFIGELSEVIAGAAVAKAVVVGVAVNHTRHDGPVGEVESLHGSALGDSYLALWTGGQYLRAANEDRATLNERPAEAVNEQFGPYELERVGSPSHGGLAVRVVGLVGLRCDRAAALDDLRPDSVGGVGDYGHI